MNKETADLLQLIALPMELVGLTLAAIEIKFPAAASRIKGIISRNAQQLPAPSRWTRPFHTAWGNFLLGTWFFFMLLFLWDHENPQIFSIVSFVCVCLVLPFASFRVAKDWVPGREVGTVGIIMAGYGVVLECYQFAFVLSE